MSDSRVPIIARYKKVASDNRANTSPLNTEGMSVKLRKGPRLGVAPRLNSCRDRANTKREQYAIAARTAARNFGWFVREDVFEGRVPCHSRIESIRHRSNARQNGAGAVEAEMLLPQGAIETQRGTAGRGIVYQNVTVCIGSCSAQRLPLGGG